VARRRKTRSGRFSVVVILGLAAGGAAYYWDYLPGSWFESQADPSSARPPLTSHRPEGADTDGGPHADVPERGLKPDSADGRERFDLQRGRALLAAGRGAMQRDQLVTARAQLTEALVCDLPLEELVRLKADLTLLAEETLLSRKILPEDPFVVAHIIQPGETLGKIARRYAVTDDLLARINGIANKNRIRAGQRIKVVRGPFHAVVTKADYRLEVYLNETFVKQYPVGLGDDGSTPTGRWKVKNKLKNPQYYPPRGGQIVLADDPENPLGERWIGLEGIEGEAVGQERYGIHGTIEPASIGQSVSLGCIRLYNADVEELYEMLVEGKSEVTVR
jgi:lipoprotein-anchoring transpeptidase ErfK/SrfK